MGVLHLTGKLLKGALIGGIVALMLGCGFLSVLGTVSGYGPVALIYFIGYVFYYAIPVGLLIGAVVGIFRMVRNSPERISALSGIWIGLLILIFVAMVVIPHVAIGEERTITHGARWSVDASTNEDCVIPVVTLLLYEYAHYEEVCSAELLETLEIETREVIPISYNVTYDFGKARGYSLNSVGTVVILYPGWLGGGDECGHELFPACDSTQAQNDGLLYESSWVGE